MSKYIILIILSPFFLIGILGIIYRGIKDGKKCGKEFKTRPLRKAQWRITATGNLYCGKKCWTRGKIKHDRKNLTDAYIKTLIRSEKSFGLVKGVIPQFMIEMKREEILFARKAEEIKKNG